MAKSLLSQISKELESIEEIDYHEPDGELDPEATIVGELDDYHRRMITLQRNYAFTAELSFSEATQANLRGAEELAKDWFRKGSDAASMAKILGDLFWISLRNQHEEIRGKVMVFIAKGWKFGYLEPEVLQSRAAGTIMQQQQGSSMLAVTLGALISLACIGLAGAAIAMLVIGDMHSASILGLLILTGIVGFFLMWQKIMPRRR